MAVRPITIVVDLDFGASDGVRDCFAVGFAGLAEFDLLDHAGFLLNDRFFAVFFSFDRAVLESSIRVCQGTVDRPALDRCRPSGATVMKAL